MSIVSNVILNNVLTYIKTQQPSDFNQLEGRKVFNHETKVLSILDRCVFYVDWREKETHIVQDCESIINTGALSAYVDDGQANEPNTLHITYKGNQFKTPFTNTRDPALKLLNKALTPDYEIRFCLNTHGSDTLGFIILSAAQWHIIKQHTTPSVLNELFEPIHDDSKLFERAF